MRFSVDMLLNGSTSIIPSDYRRNILALIKEAININQAGAEIYKKYYVDEARKIKPFTFSVSFRTDECKKWDLKLSGYNVVGSSNYGISEQ